MRLLLPLIATVTIAAFAAAAMAPNDLRDRATLIFRPLPTTAPVIDDNPANAAKVELGKMLFFDPRLSRSGTISCSTCHKLDAGGADNRPVSVGHGGQLGRRNALTVFNSVFNIAQFWDGRAPDLRTQAKQPMQMAVEMNNTPARVEETLKSIPEYVERFGQAFPDDESPVNFENVVRSIEVFEATLITPNSPFDRFLLGDDDAMSEQEQRGLYAFIFNGCTACHRGINVGGNAFFRFGMMKDPSEELRPPQDSGRSEVTGRVLLDEYYFRVAPLRNVALTPPYFHSGQVWKLDEAVRIMARTQLDAPITDQDVDDIVAFLKSLTGEPPQVAVPELPASTDTTPKPEP